MATVYNVPKIKEILGDIPAVPQKYTKKKKRPKELAVVIEANCTGCEACVAFCPVDCIEKVPESKYTDTCIPPVQIRYDECIGCEICLRVCAKLAWDAIVMRPTDEVEAELGLKIHQTWPPSAVEAKAAQATQSATPGT